MKLAASPAHIQIDKLTFDYGGERPAVDSLSFDIAKGEFIGLLGPSGCGKSTTLRMFAGLLAPTSGQIIIGGENIVSRPPWERNLGLVFQSYALFPHMTVAQNVAFGLRLRKVGKEEAAARVTEALRAVRLEGFGTRRPAELSGGQQQRVAIARAIVIEPEILLLDEPLSNLDARLRDEMRFEIRDIQTRTGITTLFVTHDQQEALTMCDRIAVMNGGRLEQIGTPVEVYDKAATPFVAGFIGRANSVSATLSHMASTPQLSHKGQLLPAPRAEDLPKDAADGGKLSAMVRPHAIQLGKSNSGLTARVIRSVFVGSIIEVELELAGGQTLVAELRPGSDEAQLAQPGAEVALSWRSTDMRIFAA
ncbi:ABC transporter ATP-binding protein [Agrobacterium rhizogenes]|uniref:ABC transporter ATP-binding protein n=1 Tax=Rhizobium rhizogenes TaxID=359 RepID=UPI0006456F12|nr:ABC transporter ATP-binding protein [Rhizobium rhizogenes]NTI24546.1 ABC transporter ATP-binding protein [Rhizobium rhizogenes]NTI50627.1 ABC transporter ATP-binding protein [Rhizobium rhizogenes]NTI63848.1 ABC transporter ATP-binding protein [Rhizobium rhizogenes]NTI95999.1 ABC transporter ATP-binding protein [Rhizobium rhizogenes]NTJ58469.1 ABC transporter ATP-binding protein [Rhizobium rhizogenes]